MTAHRPRTLEDLRHATEAAWLWDAARGRIVWANAKGLAVFGASSVFDLIDRPFDIQEEGVAALIALAPTLQPGEPQTAVLRFASAAAASEIVALCSQHLLADGRAGVLVVEEPPRPALADAAPDVAAQTLIHLPLAVLLLDREGHIVHANGAARSFLPLEHGQPLAQIFAKPERAAVLLAQISGVALTGATETLLAATGPREARLVLSRLPAGGTAHFCLTAEDVTDRRALERDAQFTATPPVIAADKAFAQLAKSLQEKINGDAPPQPAPATPAKIEATPGPQAEAAAPKPRKPVEAVASVPPIPDAIRKSFEASGKPVLVGRGSSMLFASRKAAELLGYDSPEALMADGAAWTYLRNGLEPRPSHSIAHPRDDGVMLDVAACAIPWLNGPAEQLLISKAVAKPAPEEPLPEAAPRKLAVVAKAAAAAVLEAAPTPPPTAEAPAAPAPAPAAPLAADVIAAQELKALLDVASDGIIGLSADGDILSFSAGAEAIFGLAERDARGRPFAGLLTADCRKLFRDYLAALSGPGLAHVFNDGREVTAQVQPDGEVPLFLTLGRLQSPGSQAAFCAVVRDITQWKRTEQELRAAKEAAERASQKKSDFLAAVSHELRTPLNAILGFSDVMQTERLGAMKNERYRAYAHDIHASGSHLLAIVNDLLDLSKVEAGKLELDFTSVSPAEAIDNAVRLLQEEASRAGVVIRKSYAPGLPRVVADLRSLRQVLLNLLSNAIKYTDAGGQVIASAQMEKDGSLLIRIKDTGIGMNAAQVRDALEPYARVDVDQRQRQGTGLGLPLSKALVEANRAQFTLTSEAGQGTSVDIRFPAQRVLAE